MALDNAKVKEELNALRSKREGIERKIKGLESYLGIDKSNGTNGVSARGGVDIRPAVKEIYIENENQPIKLADLVERVATKLDVEHQLVDKKMVHVKRTMLKRAGYGMYQLNVETPKTEVEGVG